MVEGDEITEEHLKKYSKGGGTRTVMEKDFLSGYLEKGISLPEIKKTVEKEAIGKVLAMTHGNIARAAGILGIGQSNLYKKIKRYGI